MAQTILVVDDHANVRTLIKEYLSELGYRVVSAGDGAAALAAASREPIDLILLDVMMPNLDGFEFLKIYRKEHDVPIILLTARLAESDKVLGLELGADDYVTKPFGMQELLARIRAALRRRTARGTATSFAAKDLNIDFEARMVAVRGRDVHLTPKEFELLRHLVLNAGKPLTHRRLLQAVWGPDYGDEPEYLRVMINQLRKKLESDPTRPKLILTEPWVGYRFQAPRESKHPETEPPED